MNTLSLSPACSNKIHQMSSAGTTVAARPQASSMPPPQMRVKGLSTGPSSAAAAAPPPPATVLAAAVVHAEGTPSRAGGCPEDSDKVLTLKRMFDSIKKAKAVFKSDEAFKEFALHAYKRRREEPAAEEVAARRAIADVDAEIEVTKDKLTKLMSQDMI